MKHHYLLIVFLCFQIGLFAQETTVVKDSIWSHDGSVNFTFSNVGLENWAGGGENSISLGILSNYQLDRTTEASIWTTNLNAAYGIARVGESNNLFKKTDDQLIFLTNYNLRLNENWNVTAYADFRTQFTPGYTFAFDSVRNKEVEDQEISRFMAPGYLVTGLGISYHRGIFKATLSPATTKLTFVLQDSLSNVGAFGVDEGKNVRSEFGASFLGSLDVPVMENINFKTNLNLFYNYETPELMDVNWETFLVFKINDFFNTSFSTQLIYDSDVDILQADGTSSSEIQFKHVLNVNVGFTF